MKRLVAKIVDKFVKKTIVFESKPLFSDNTKAVYDEMVRRGYDKKYNLVWFIDWSTCATIQNNKIVYWNCISGKTLKEKLRNYSFSQPKCIICCNTFISSAKFHGDSNGKLPKSFYLTHGTPMKSVRAYYSAPDGIDYSISPSAALNSLISNEFNIPEDAVFATGFPRNDVFSRPVKSLNQVLGEHYKKIIIWYPTYRQNASHSIDLHGSSLPLIHDEKNAQALNDVAHANNVLIIIKPHFAQDVSQIKKINLCNIKLIDDSFFTDNNISSYELLAGSDALITDYSSVYFDYTLCDKPIGVIWEDIDEYKKFPGFAVDLSQYLKGAEKIYQIEELCAFVKAVADDKDNLQTERREIRDLCNYSTDGHNTARVVDFIVKTAQL